MRRTVLTLLSALSLGACATNELASDPEALTREAEARSEILADRFQRELMSALTAAMATEGPQGAIGVCSSIAPALAAQVSEESDATVRRTALRTRNPAAKADATEQRVMEGWANAPLGEDGKPRRWTAHECRTASTSGLAMAARACRAGSAVRLSIARAILAARPWLLLDEPSEGLDLVTEARLARRLDTWLRETGTGLIVVSHRRALLALAGEGRIVELGE